MTNYILVESFHRANVQNRLYYVMEESDLDTLKSEEKLTFGDRAYAVKEKSYHVYGNDDTWYDM